MEKKIADPDDYAIPETLEFAIGAFKVSYSHTPSHWYNGEIKVEVKITEPDNYTTIATVDKELFNRTLTLLLLQKRTHHSAYQYSLTGEGKIDLREANLAGVDVKYADLSSANLRGTNLKAVDMRHAILTRASLANLKFAWLADADLEEATLTGAVCCKTKLWRAHLIGANLSHAGFTCADLSHAKLSNACLRDTTLQGAQLASAKFEGTFVDGASFNNITLRGTHSGPMSGHVPSPSCRSCWRAQTCAVPAQRE
ncbi:Secreted effector protein pipB2 [Sodalis glossinidius str. 'morsitans']|uniref:Secreted effector protein pipB2 n=1 Tax=Sodalis glossinidius (strain morsitans) TaxID=343509 RepID=Q2NWW0_SODGM|nr:pentapeptide repeat-containing protein [Sodalis glossinidius]BAE73365.1 hypothetical protein SG0090 [Sodalis glossinidius str. 'morsitans']CRL43690.1 Secreted effector protein pipB2 [Sodalis glossinidius str. 'morsitans']